MAGGRKADDAKARREVADSSSFGVFGLEQRRPPFSVVTTRGVPANSFSNLSLPDAKNANAANREGKISRSEMGETTIQIETTL